MSGHFVYEIDERKLRVRLQEIEIESKQDDWSNFEAYYLSLNHPKNQNALKNLNIPFSMNIILPLVFGGTIIIIAVILFKFISISNPKNTEPAPNNEASQKPVLMDSLVTSKPINNHPIKDTIAKPVISSSLSLELLQAAELKRADSLAQASKKEDTSIKKNPQAAKSKLDSSSAKAIQTHLNSANNQEVTKPKKKKQRKVSSDSVIEKIPEEIPNTLDENDASLKQN